MIPLSWFKACFCLWIIELMFAAIVHETDHFLINQSKTSFSTVTLKWLDVVPTRSSQCSSLRQITNKKKKPFNIFKQLAFPRCDGRPALVPHQFTCSRAVLKECVASEQSQNVTHCLLRNLTRAAEDGFTVCSNQTRACPFPEVSPTLSSVCVCVCSRILACTAVLFCFAITFSPPLTPPPSLCPCCSISATACCSPCWPALSSCTSAASGSWL